MIFNLKFLCGSFAVCGLSFFGSGCASNQPPLPKAQNVSLERFMGPWFVIGYTPILVDKAAHNAVEHYYLNADRKIETTYRFRDGSFDGPIKTYTPTGFPDKAPGDAEWRMQFIWPFKSPYIIMHLSEDEQQTIIAHPSRKYAWIMQRSPEMDDNTYNTLLSKLKDVGYDTSVIKRLPQDWSQDQERMQKIVETGATAPLEPR